MVGSPSPSATRPLSAFQALIGGDIDARTVVALDANHALLALALAPARLVVIAAVSWRRLIDVALGADDEEIGASPPRAVAVRLSEDGKLVAWADEGGGVRAYRFGAALATRTGQFGGVVLVCLLRARLTCPARSLAWQLSATSLRLLGGDEDGAVWLWLVPDADDGDLANASLVTSSAPGGTCRGSMQSPVALLPAEGSPIVQLDVRNDRVLVSTWARSLLLNLPRVLGTTLSAASSAARVSHVPVPVSHVAASATGTAAARAAEAAASLAVTAAAAAAALLLPPLSLPPPHPIGRAKRDGAFGACFIEGRLPVSPEAILVAARPGRRLWLVDAVGNVLSTLRLSAPPATSADAAVATADAAAAVVAADADAVVAADAIALAQHDAIALGRLRVVSGLRLLLSWGETSVGERRAGQVHAERRAGHLHVERRAEHLHAEGETSAGEGTSAQDGAHGGCVCLVDVQQVAVVAAVTLEAPVRSVACLGLVEAVQGDAARHDARWSLQLAVVHGTAPRLSHVQLPVRPEDLCGAEENEKPCDPKDAALDAALDAAAAEPPLYDSAAEDSAAAATGATGTTGDVAPVGVPEDATATVATSAATATVATSLQLPSPADVADVAPPAPADFADFADFAPAAVSSHVLQQLQRRVEQRRLEAQRSPDTALEARRSPAATGRRAVSSAREVAVVREIEIAELEISEREIAEREISIEAVDEARADVAGMAAAAMGCAAPAAAGGDAAVAPDVLACMRSPRRLATGGDAAVAPAAKAKATVAALFDGELPNLATPLTWYEGLSRALHANGLASQPLPTPRPLASNEADYVAYDEADYVAYGGAYDGERAQYGAAAARGEGEVIARDVASREAAAAAMRSLGAAQPALALGATALIGFPTGWRDGCLGRALAQLGARLSLQQWQAMLRLAQHLDDARRRRRRRRTAAHGGASVAAAVGGGGGKRGEPSDAEGEQAGHGAVPSAPRPLPGAVPGATGRATLLVLRGMLKAQAATVCLGVLRGAPRLAEALPPRGYVELLRAVAREHSRGAVVGAVEAAPESEGAFGLDLEHDLPFEVPA